MDKTFGEFLAECRQKKGLTQKELAEKLFVSESAISKWESNKRRPDIELVSKLSEIFGLTESELIRASIDNTRIKERQQARKFRIIENTYNLILFIGFGVTLLTCFIVNLSVSHTLSWFFIVLCAIVLASIVLILPQFIHKYKLLIIPLAWFFGLVLLIGVCCVYTAGDWFFIPFFSLLLAYSLIFTPILIAVYLPQRYKDYNAYLSLLIDAVLLQILLIAIDIYCSYSGIQPFGWSFSIAFAILGYWLFFAFWIVFIFRRKSFGWQIKVAILFGSLANFLLLFIHITKLLSINPNINFAKMNLLDWSSDIQISTNVNFLVLSGLFLIMLFFFCLQILKKK